MSEIALAKINSFAPVAEQADVSPEEPIFVLTGSQLQDIISKAVLPLQAELQDLKDTVAFQGEKIAALEATQDLQAENSFIQLQLINDLRKDREPQPLQKDRAQVLRALLVAAGGKMLAKEARKLMHLPENTFSELLKTCDFIESRPYHLDKRQLLLIIN